MLCCYGPYRQISFLTSHFSFLPEVFEAESIHLILKFLVFNLSINAPMSSSFSRISNNSLSNNGSLYPLRDSVHKMYKPAAYKMHKYNNDNPKLSTKGTEIFQR